MKRRKQQKLSDLFKKANRNEVSDETTSDSYEPNTDETG